MCITRFTTCTDRAVLAAVATGLLLVAAAPRPLVAGELADAFTAEGFYAELRWRAEHVDQDPFTKDAFAVPLRARLGFESGSVSGFSVKAEYDYVFALGQDHYNEGGGNTPDRARYPVIADPQGGDLNQLFLQWRSAAGSQLRAGRQRIIYDNARFIGNVGWRQNEQTYDSIGFERLDWQGFDLRLAWLDAVRRIFGDDVPAGEHELDSWLANLGWKAGDRGRLTAYWYDIDNRDDASASTSSAGLRWAGTPALESLELRYALEWARQRDAANNPVDYRADYLRADLSAKWGRPTWSLGYESLGGDASRPGAAFRTPLATLHAFNGWADQFLTTPSAGLVDLFAGLKGPLGPWTWNLVFHDFSAESGSADFGSELDASMERKLGDRFSLLLKAARFETDDPGFGDTTKLWVQVSAAL